MSLRAAVKSALRKARMIENVRPLADFCGIYPRVRRFKFSEFSEQLDRVDIPARASIQGPTPRPGAVESRRASTRGTETAGNGTI